MRAGRSLSFLAKKKVTKESCPGSGESHERYSGLRSASLPSRPRRVIDYRTRKAIARGSGRSFTKSFTLCHRPRLSEYRCTIFWKIQLGARTTTRVDASERFQLTDFPTHRHPPLPVDRQCARSRTKLCFRPSRTAAFDQAWPMSEREAFGAPMSQISSVSFPGAVINATTRTRGERSGTKSRPSLMRFPVPKATFFGYFLFCQKRK